MPSMATSASPAIDAPSLLGTATGDLWLRLSAGSRPAQVLRIRSSKCTIGTWPGCTLRIKGPRSTRLYCCIFRGAVGTVVRSWSSETRLNGGAFRDAPLCPGDCLSCGPVELQVLDGPPEGIPVVTNRLAEDVRQQRGRCRRLILALREARTQVERLEVEMQVRDASRHDHGMEPQVRVGGVTSPFGTGTVAQPADSVVREALPEEQRRLAGPGEPPVRGRSALAEISVALVGLVVGTVLLLFPVGQSRFGWGLQVLGGILAFLVAIVWSLTAVAKLWREPAPAVEPSPVAEPARGEP